MRYIDTGGQVVPKHCKFGPRPAEGLLFDNLEWWSITDHLVRERRDRELAAVLKAKEEAKRQISLDMTRTWNNTLASIKTHGNQKRIEQREKEKKDKLDEYNRILETRKQDKHEILEDVRKRLQKDNDNVKLLTSAVMFSMVLDGRKKQIEHKNRLREEEAKKETELAAQLKREAEEFAREKLQEKIDERERMKIQRESLNKQMAEARQKKEAELQEVEAERQDMIKMRIEGEKIHHCNMVEKKYRKDFAAKYIQKTTNQLDYERNLVLEQQEEDEINNIYIKYDRRFKKERKEREERIRNEEVEKRLRRAEKLAQALAQAEEEEDQRVEAARRQKEEEAMREQESKDRMRRNALADIVAAKNKAEERRAREQRETKEAKKWEMMQMYKSVEINEEWRESERRKKRDAQAETRAAYDAQCREAEERRAKDLKEWLAPLEDARGDAEKVLASCQDALDFVDAQNLPSYPVQAAVARVKQLNGLWQDPQQERHRERKQGEDSEEGCSGGKKLKQAPLRSGCYCFKC